MVISLFYIGIMIILQIVVGLHTSITDFKYGKIFNKNIGVFFVIAVTFQTIWVVYLSYFETVEIKYVVLKFLVNFLIGAGVGIILYYYNIWAAGDAKLYILELIIIPTQVISRNSLEIFPGFVLLIIIFSLGFLYITIDTIFLLIKESYSKESFNFNKVSLKKDVIIKIFLIYGFTFVFNFAYNDVLKAAFPLFYQYNIGILKFTSFIIILIILGRNLSNLFYVISIFIGLSYLIVKLIVFANVSRPTFDMNFILLIIIVIIVRHFASRYNYKKITTEHIKPGMILSYTTIMLFINSRIKGLPCYTTESPHSRLTDEETESIKRWAKSKNGKSYIYIVRQIPFAPFISLGTAIYIIYILLM